MTASSSKSESQPIAASSQRGVLWAIGLLLIGYGLAAAFELPQNATLMINQAAVGANPAPAAPVPLTPPAYWTVLPFCLLLAAIAVFPLSLRTEHWWESNLHKFYVAAGLGLVVLVYYGFIHAESIERHFLGHAHVERPQGAVFAWEHTWTIVANAILQDFVPFIILLFSLYTISGGIRIEGDLPAHPVTNTLFLAVGAVLASFIGTTGAAMLLIRPLLETNRERKHVRHTVVFFIFVVCNCGGCLLPLGDPPLFLGYLQGVPFLWTLKLWKAWLLVNGTLLAIYYTWDRFRCYPREEPRDVARDEARIHRLRFGGIWPNAVLLLAVVLAVALLDVSKLLPGTNWHPWLYLRECVLLALVALSLAIGPESIRHGNKFTYGAIVEVAALFLGIFICMQPALQILHVRGPQLGINTAPRFFWTTGALSSVLDNAPTYLVFFETAAALPAGADALAGVGVSELLLAAISLGAVFMGANTYIGNGPNFMVKTITEKSGIRMPSFFGYMAYSGAILLPLFVLVTVLFFL
jgi:Na+/H+ antiporter NhaD/arsenite permease-like protein